MRVLKPRPAGLPPEPRRRKYGNQPVVGKWGELYDSRAEREYAWTLEQRRLAGLIDRWAWSPRFVLQSDPPITVRFDFVYWGLDLVPRVVDIKGTITRDFSVKARLWKARRPDMPLYVVRNGMEEAW